MKEPGRILPCRTWDRCKSTAAPQEPTYQVGDTVYLEGHGLISWRRSACSMSSSVTRRWPILSSALRAREAGADALGGCQEQRIPARCEDRGHDPQLPGEDHGGGGPVLEEQMGEAGISTARFVHENGDVTFSFAEADRDAVEHILSAQREEDSFADVEKWAADYQRQTQTAIAALEPGQRRIVDAMQTAGFFL